MAGVAEQFLLLTALRKQHRELPRRFDVLLKGFDESQQQKQFHCTCDYHSLEAELHPLCWRERRQQQRINRLEERIEKLEVKNDLLRRQLAGGLR